MQILEICYGEWGRKWVLLTISKSGAAIAFVHVSVCVVLGDRRKKACQGQELVFLPILDWKNSVLYLKVFCSHNCLKPKLSYISNTGNYLATNALNDYIYTFLLRRVQNWPWNKTCFAWCISESVVGRSGNERETSRHYLKSVCGSGSSISIC